jgi:hypothetical protein
MKLGEAVEALNMVMDEYDPVPMELVRLLITHFKYTGRVHFAGQWMDIGLLLYMVPNYGKSSTTRLTFFGGAPGSRHYYEGTLIDFITEVCLWELVHGDKNKYVYEFIHARIGEQIQRHELEHGI